MPVDKENRECQTVLVTGIAGFIGFHFAKKLLSLGYRVIGIDNLNPYYDVNLKRGRLKELGFSAPQLEQLSQEDFIVSRGVGELIFYPKDLKDRGAVEDKTSRAGFCLGVDKA